MERRQYRPAAVAVPEWPRVWPLMKRRSTCAEWMANKSWCCFIFPGPLLLFTPFKIPGRHACPCRKHLDISRPVPDKLEHFPRFLIWIFTVFFLLSRSIFFFVGAYDVVKQQNKDAVRHCLVGFRLCIYSVVTISWQMQSWFRREWTGASETLFH